mgnify:CR=1 FL=1
MKKYLLAFSLLLLITAARAQTIAFFYMADMVRLSMGEVDNLLMKTGKFKLNNKEAVQGQILSSYQSIDKDGKVIKGETLVTGAYLTTNAGDHLHTVTYKTVYPKYVFNLMKQMEKLGYRQTFKGSDERRNFYIYDNVLYHVTVTFMHDHSINTVEVREKEAGIEP